MKNDKLLFIVLMSLSYNLYSQNSVTIKKGNTTFTIQGDTTKYRFKATIADYESRYEDAASYSLKAIEKGEYKPNKIKNGYYDIACYFALISKNDKAIKYLVKSVDNGWSDLGHLEYDPDLQELKNTKEWIEKIKPRLVIYYKNNNRELAKMYNDDQKARKSGQLGKDLAMQDSIRRNVVLIIISNNELKSGDDYYKAGMIMHHGTKTEDYKKAHDLLKIALTKEPIPNMAPWLFAASKDRLLISEGKPQWFGTQNMEFVNGKIAMNPNIIDTTAVTSERRKELNSPTIETLRKYIMNFKSGQ